MRELTAPPTPPGWYLDPAGIMRWWDGHQWTPYTAAPAMPPMPVAPPRPPEPKGFEPALIEPGTLDRGLAGRVRLWQVVLVGFAAAAVIVVVAWLLVAYASDPLS